MQCSKRWQIAAVVIAGLQFPACQQKQEAPAQIDLAKVARAEQSGQALLRVRLTAKRAEQLGIKTAPVREEKISGKLCKVIPASAVVFDQKGNTWTFKNSESLVFTRERISVDSIDGDLAILSDGPLVGAAVVTVGAAQLLSDEFGETEKGLVAGKTQEGEKSAGTVTMQQDGSLKLVHRAMGATGFTASVVIVYKPQDEEYQKIIDQVGGLKVGETKAVPQ